MRPGLSRPPACREGPGRVLAAPAVRSSQAQVHVTNFDYNHHLLNTMPGTRPTSRARAARARGQLSPPARTAPGHPPDGPPTPPPDHMSANELRSSGGATTLCWIGHLEDPVHQRARSQSARDPDSLSGLDSWKAPSAPSVVGARNGSQRVQPQSDPARLSQILLAGQGLLVRPSPTVTDTPKLTGLSLCPCFGKVPIREARRDNSSRVGHRVGVVSADDQDCRVDVGVWPPVRCARVTGRAIAHESGSRRHGERPCRGRWSRRTGPGRSAECPSARPRRR
jgi:hypothetical protein